MICLFLQADVALGLDDVVITYMDGHKKFVQVKHTRANDTLTFGDLVTIDTSNVDANSHISLLGELAKSWNEEHSKYSTTDILLFSNRKKGKRIAHAGPQRSIKRPALKSNSEVNFLESPQSMHKMKIRCLLLQ